jgi:hypothetical protein
MARTDDELPKNLDLDSEGIAPPEGALPEKEITGDPRRYLATARIFAR